MISPSNHEVTQLSKAWSSSDSIFRSGQLQAVYPIPHDANPAKCL